jgi:Ca2+-binding RTX toxin-like protein
LNGGGGDDTLHGRNGNDTLSGGRGNDDLDGGTRDEIGGIADADLVILRGSRSDYTFRDYLSSGETLVTHSDGEFESISNFEEMQFHQPFGTNPISFDNLYVELARLSRDAYRDNPISHSGWKFVHANQLGLPIEHDPLSLVNWTMANGVYKAVNSIAGFPNVAVAHVYEGVSEGEKTLVLAFRGTDEFSDLVGATNITQYYNQFRPLIDGIRDYVTDAGMEQILVTGHSLGGMLAQTFMAEVAGDSKYHAATFGSPGTGLLPQIDDRMIHFAHTEDEVANLPQQYSGEEIWIPMNDLDPVTGSSDDGLSIYPEHEMIHYLINLENMLEVTPSLPFLTLRSHTPGKETHIFADNNGANHFGGDNTLTNIDEQLFGMGGDDTIEGFWGDDELDGGIGNDYLIGGSSFYQSAALQDDDLLIGGADDDKLQGGRGADRLAGGPGKDEYIFLRIADSTIAQADVITRFEQGLEKINLSRIDAKATAGNQDFTFIGTGAFSGQAGQLRFSVNGAQTIVSGDINGDGSPDFAIKLLGSYSLTEVDFML